MVAATLMYDEAGHLVGEYTGSGALIEETVWLGDLPVATLRPNGSGGISIYYIHADQLNASRAITRPVDNAIVWRWDTDPFGTSAPNPNPQGLGTFLYNLRFPGQYYQAETNLNYNMARDYDPATGRYVESDPIGLDGGSYSTYAYVGGDPIRLSDPTGLWIPPIHKKMATASANQAGCSNIAPQIGVATAHVDALPTSQDPANSFWHAMSDGTAKQSANEAMQFYDAYVAKYSSSCKIDDLARALHAVEDSFSPAHEGFQSWMGFSNTSYFSLAIHGLKDGFPAPSTYGAAVQAGADIMSQAASRCPCLCNR
jgi:RHS repeat-associated protein